MAAAAAGLVATPVRPRLPLPPARTPLSWDRAIGLVDMAYAILNGRVARASGQLGLHCLEVMEGMLISAAERRFYPLRSTCQRPQALAIDFPHGE